MFKKSINYIIFKNLNKFILFNSKIFSFCKISTDGDNDKLTKLDTSVNISTWILLK